MRRPAQMLALTASMLSSACAHTHRPVVYGNTIFLLVNRTGDVLLYGVDDPDMYGVIEPGGSATVGPFGTMRGCRPISPRAIECLQLFQGGALVYQITPSSADRWILREHPGCVWEYERTIERSDLAVVADTARCK